MTKLTYKEAFDKITEAYIKGELQILRSDFCFCGTLSGNTCDWENNSDYSVDELIRMEKALFSPFEGIQYLGIRSIRTVRKINIEFVYEYLKTLGQQFEDLLFQGMSLALDELKQIHKERGENVEDFQFTKRQNLNLCHNTQK